VLQNQQIQKILQSSSGIIGIKTDNELDSKSLIILSEAHLVTRSLYQTELLKFGQVVFLKIC